MKRFTLLSACMAAIVLSLTVRSAHAVPIISNYPPPNNGDGSTIAANVVVSKAAGFTMPDDDYQLDEAIVRLLVDDLQATAQFDLFADVGGNPGGSSLLSFLSPTLTAGRSNYTLLPANPFVLLANQTYWLTATGESSQPNGILWLAANPGVTPTGVATSAGYRFSSGQYPPTDSSSTENTYQINATLLSNTDPAAVPEPASLAGLGLLAATLVVGRRRRALVG